MTSAVTIKIHEAPTQTPLELAQFEQMSHIPSQFDEGIRLATKQRRFLTPPVPWGASSVWKAEAPRKSSEKYFPRVEQRVLQDAVSHSLVDLTDAAAPTPHIVKAKVDSCTKRRIEPFYDSNKGWSTDGCFPSAGCPPWLASALTDMLLDVKRPIYPPLRCPPERIVEKNLIQAADVPDVESGLDKKTESDFATSTLCSLWGSIFSGGCAGESLQACLELMDKNYKYVQKETTGYYARIVCTSAQHGLDFGVGESPSNPFYVKFSSDESRHSSYGTRLQLTCYFRRAGTYQFDVVRRLENTSITSKCSVADVQNTLPYNEQHIEGPRSFCIHCAPAYGPSCVLEGVSTSFVTNGNSGTLEVIPGEIQSRLLKTVDRFGNNCTTGDARVEVLPAGCVQVCSVTNRHNGEYEIKFIVLKYKALSSASALRVLVNELPLKGGGLVRLVYPGNSEYYALEARPFRLIKTGYEQRDSSGERIALPVPPTCPPFPDADTVKQILPPSCLSLLVPSLFVQMNNYETQLLRACDQLIKSHKRKTPTYSNTIIATLEHASICKVEVAEAEKALTELEKTIRQSQQELQRQYQLLATNTVDALPVTIEVDNIQQIQENHEKERKRLKEVYETLTQRVETMKEDYRDFLHSRDTLTKDLTSLLADKEASVAHQLRYLADLHQKLHHYTLHALKRQLRREDRDACAPLAMQAEQTIAMRNELLRCIKESTPIERRQRVPQESQQLKVSEPEPRKPVSRTLTPQDPTTPAFWFAEGRYRPTHRRSALWSTAVAARRHPFVARVEHQGLTFPKQAEPSSVAPQEKHEEVQVKPALLDRKDDESKEGEKALREHDSIPPPFYDAQHVALYRFPPVPPPTPPRYRRQHA